MLWSLVLLTSGCATMQSQDKPVFTAQLATEAGSIEAAIAKLDATAPTDEDKKQILYQLERGELLRLNRQYADSNATLLQADERIKAWEDAAANHPQKLLGTGETSPSAHRSKPYEGQDYEKVMLSTRLALNRMARGDWQTARMDLKRTHEREALISAFRAQETAQTEAEASEKGIKGITQELKDYPVETLHEDEVLSLKNGHQNALSHYLAGFLHEAFNEPGLAAPSYQKAIELKPDSAVLDDGLRELKMRNLLTHQRKQRKTDVLFLIETGFAPARKPMAFTVPVLTQKGLVRTSISYPVITPSLAPDVFALQIGSISLKPQPVLDFNLMARRALKDEMPGLILREASRTIAKAEGQDQAIEKFGPFGERTPPTISKKRADDRMWRMLPERVYMVRRYFSPGQYWVKLDKKNIGMVHVDGQYAVVPVRLFANSVLVGDVATWGVLPEVEPAPPAAQPTPVKKGRRKPAPAKNTPNQAPKDRGQ